MTHPYQTGGSATLSVTDKSRGVRGGDAETVRLVGRACKPIRAGKIKNLTATMVARTRNDSAAVGLNPGSVVSGSDELRGQNVPDRAWRAARSQRSLVHGTHRYLAGTT